MHVTKVVDFQGSRVLMPFMTPEHCGHHLQSITGILEGIHVPSLEFGICRHLADIYTQVGVDADAAYRIWSFFSNVNRVNGHYFGYLDVNVARQLGHRQRDTGSNQPGDFSYAVRTLWLEEQVAILKST